MSDDNLSTVAARDELKSYVERIERIVEEITALKDDQRLVFAEAKTRGFDTKAIRRIVKRRQKDPTEIAEAEAIDGTYMHALGMQADSVLHVQVARLAREGMSREEVVKAFQLLIPINGEIIVAIGGQPMRLWRTEDGKSHAEDYVPALLDQFMSKRKADK